MGSCGKTFIFLRHSMIYQKIIVSKLYNIFLVFIILQALPGGMPGAEYLRDSAPLIDILEKQKAAGKLYAAICAAPAVVLASKGLVGEGATCFPAPGLLEMMSSPVDDDVVIQGNVITSKGPGTALKFAVALGEQLYGAEKAKSVADALLIKY
jgi:protein deglycase